MERLNKSAILNLMTQPNWQFYENYLIEWANGLDDQIKSVKITDPFYKEKIIDLQARKDNLENVLNIQKILSQEDYDEQS